MKSVIWVFVNSNNRKEAELIGNILLKERLVACYSLTKKLHNVYYWPPRVGKLEQNRGPQIILETLPRNYKKIQKRVKQLHSDKVPFIGYVEMKGITEGFYGWMNGEVE
jgi:periplasmic divalent cation tolerance protein